MKTFESVWKEIVEKHHDKTYREEVIEIKRKMK